MGRVECGAGSSDCQLGATRCEKANVDRSSVKVASYISPNRAVNTLRLVYTNQSVNAV